MAFLGMIDAVGAFAVFLTGIMRVLPKRRVTSGTRNLLIIDTSYDLEALRSRGAQTLLDNRNLEGFFQRVWSTHPLVGASPAHRGGAHGPPRVLSIDADHLFIEGHSRWTIHPSRWPRIGAARAQAAFLSVLDRSMRPHGVSVVHVSDPYYPGLLGYLLARRFRSVLVVRVSGNYDRIFEETGQLAYPRLIPSRRLERAIARFVLRRASLVFPANANNLEFAVANGAERDRCVTIPAYANVLEKTHLSDPGTRRRPADIPAGDYLFMISRLEKVKYPEDSISVLSRLRKAGYEVNLVIAGDGSMRSELQKMADDLGVGSAVYLVGDRPQEWIAGAAAHAKVVLSPLTGRALVEALLSGRPVVAYETEWQSEVIADRQTGLLVEFRDVEAMSEATLQLLADPALAVEIGMRARHSILRIVDPDVVLRRQQDAYLKAISGSTTRLQ